MSAAGTIDAPLDLFGGPVTDMPAAILPQRAAAKLLGRAAARGTVTNNDLRAARFDQDTIDPVLMHLLPIAVQASAFRRAVALFFPPESVASWVWLPVPDAAAPFVAEADSPAALPVSGAPLLAEEVAVPPTSRAVPVAGPSSPRVLEERAAPQVACSVSAQVPPAGAFSSAAQRALRTRVPASALVEARQP
jgi:hypothetical protein